MNLGRKLLSAGDTLADRALCVVGAVLFSQAPEFMQQYLQRLGGHLDEARRQLAQFQHAAAQTGLTLDRLIAQTAANADPAVAKLGGVMTEAVARTEHLQAAHDALLSASLWTRPFVFLRYLEADIARATWRIFQPAVPTTFEGLAYALLGMLVLLALYHGVVRGPLARLGRARPRVVAR
ncbi:MAG: DUF2937 family protein [Opitutae bacterium]|nr:DUF2937 family protein [Opitutae bacterium]